jgi:hypothetical protein
MPTQVRILDLPPARSAPRRGTEQPDGTQVVSSTPCRAPAHPAQAGLLTCGGTTTARLQSWRPDDGPRGKAGRRESAIGSPASRARLVTPGPCTTRACGRSGLLTLLTRYGAVSLGWHTHVIRPTDTPAFSEGRSGRYSAVSVKTDSNRWTQTTYNVRFGRLKRLACLIFRPVRNAWLCRHTRLRAAGADALTVRAPSMYARWSSVGSAPSALVGESPIPVQGVRSTWVHARPMSRVKR